MKKTNGVWNYDDVLKMNDTASACVRTGTTEDVVREGIANGVLSCEDYFVLP